MIGERRKTMKHDLVSKILYKDKTELLLMFPAFAFVATPAIQLVFPVYKAFVKAFFSFEANKEVFYHETVKWAIILSAVFGCIGIISYFFKEKNRTVKRSAADYIPCFFFAGLCIWMAVSTCINGFTDYALYGQEYRDESIFYFVAYFALFWFCSFLVKEDKYKKYLLRFFAVTGFTVNAATLLYTVFSGKMTNPADYVEGEGLSVVFFHFNHYGYYLMLTVIAGACLFVFEKDKKYKILPAFSMLLGAALMPVNRTFGCFVSSLLILVVLTIISLKKSKDKFVPAVVSLCAFVFVTFIVGLKYTSFYDEIADMASDIAGLLNSSEKIILFWGILALMAITAAGMCICYRKKKKAFFVILLILTGTLVFAFTCVDTVKYAEFVDSLEQFDHASMSMARKKIGSMGNGRGSLWFHTIKYIFEKPWFGFGIEGISERLSEETYALSNRPHNEFLQYAVFFGIPALLMYLGGIITSVLPFSKQGTKRTDAQTVCLLLALSYLFSSLFGNTMFYTAAFLPIFLGLANTSNENTPDALS